MIPVTRFSCSKMIGVSTVIPKASACSIQPEAIIGSTPSKFSPLFQPDGRKSGEKAHEMVSKALTGKPQVFEWVHQRQDGSLIDTEITLTSSILVMKHSFNPLSGILPIETSGKRARCFAHKTAIPCQSPYQCKGR